MKRFPVRTFFTRTLPGLNFIFISSFACERNFLHKFFSGSTSWSLGPRLLNEFALRYVTGLFFALKVSTYTQVLR